MAESSRSAKIDEAAVGGGAETPSSARDPVVALGAGAPRYEAFNGVLCQFTTGCTSGTPLSVSALCNSARSLAVVTEFSQVENSGSEMQSSCSSR